MITIRLTKPKPLEAVAFTRADMIKIGAKAKTLITHRVLRGQDVNDRQMRPLSKAYQKKKEALGQPGIRNMQFSGSMLGSLDIVEVAQDRVVLGFDRRAELTKAQKNDDRSKWFGLSRNDQGVVGQFAERILANKQ